jgi:hypothetical protein
MYVDIPTFWILEETEISAFFTSFASTELRTETKGSHILAIVRLVKLIVKEKYF